MLVLVHVLATLALLLIAAGLFFAANRRKHVPLMLAAFGLDMAGLLIVEFTANPFTSLTQQDDGWLIRVIHACFATASLVGYIIQIVTGRKLLRADRSALPLHNKSAKVFLVTRLLAYITMFMV